MHYFGNQNNDFRKQIRLVKYSMLYDFEYSSSEKLDCGNVVNKPYWLHVTCSRVL